jgi:hypothetical protein
MSTTERALVGGLGGLCAILAKYVSQDHATVMQYMDSNLPSSKLFTLIAGYLILTPILMILGAIIAGVTDEANRLKVFALGISAPALITTMSSGNSGIKIADIIDFLRPSTAIAQSNPVQQGLDSFFGSSERTYVVYLGSFKEKGTADRIMQKINETRSIRAFSTEFTSDQGLFYRVYATSLLSLKDALSLRSSLLRSGIVSEAAITEDMSRNPTPQ